jgi:hypothetical protein
MARRDLASLLGDSAEPEPAPTSAPAPDEAQTSPATPAQPRSSAQEPLYLTLVRKEARVRDDQYATLTDTSRRLNRAKKGGERITENTLIRVAIDLLTARVDELHGTTEDELRASLGLNA